MTRLHLDLFTLFPGDSHPHMRWWLENYYSIMTHIKKYIDIFPNPYRI